MPKSNLEAYHYNQETMEVFLALCLPLFTSANIKYFRYMRAFENGQYFSISNQLDYTQFYLENIKVLQGIFEPLILYAPTDKYYFYLWPDSFDTGKIKDDKVFSALHAHNIWNGLSVYRRTGNYVESWNFAGHTEDLPLKNFFINNLSFIQAYIDSFQKKSKDLTDCRNTSILASFEKPIVLPDLSKQDVPLISNVRFPIDYQQTNVIHSKPLGIPISSRQFECLKLLAKGKTMKEIGKQLNIGVRTVESHINIIKNKTGLHYKSELIDLFYQHENPEERSAVQISPHP